MGTRYQQLCLEDRCAIDKQNFIWKLKIYGTSGIVFVDMASPERPLVVYAPKHRIEGADRIVHNGMTDCYLPPLPAWDHHKDILRSFVNTIREGTILERDSSAMRQHHVIEIIAKLYESSETGRAMGLETKYGAMN